LRGDELRAVRRLQRESETSPFVFVSGDPPFSTAGFARMIERAAAGAGLDLKAHPHMLRHACGTAIVGGPYDNGTGASREAPGQAAYQAPSANNLSRQIGAMRAIARMHAARKPTASGGEPVSR
jgi:integrase